MMENGITVGFLSSSKSEGENRVAWSASAGPQMTEGWWPSEAPKA